MIAPLTGDGIAFYLLSQVGSTTDEHLRRIQAAALILSADACRMHHLARPSVTCVSHESEIPRDRAACGVIFAKDIKDPSALAFHTLTAQGFPTALVLADPAQTTIAARENGALHEIVEALGDLWCEDYRLRSMPDGSIAFDSFELVDRCQGDIDPIDLGSGDPVSGCNVLYPNAFTDAPIEGEPFDRMGLMKTPWELRPDSYAVRIYGGTVRTEATGTLAARKLAGLRPHHRLSRRLVAAHAKVHAMTGAAA